MARARKSTSQWASPVLYSWTQVQDAIVDKLGWPQWIVELYLLNPVSYASRAPYDILTASLPTAVVAGVVVALDTVVDVDDREVFPHQSATEDRLRKPRHPQLDDEKPEPERLG